MLRYHRTDSGVCQIDAIVSLPCTFASKEAYALRNSAARPYTAAAPRCNSFFTSSCCAFERLAARLLDSLPVMPGRFVSTIRNRSAVVLASAVALALCGGTTVFAAGAHRGPAAHSIHPRQYKLDNELMRRASQAPAGSTRVIVTLQPGAQLPAQLKRFAHSNKIGIINGHVVAVPNRLLNQLAADPAVFRFHYDRPTRG